MNTLTVNEAVVLPVVEEAPTASTLVEDFVFPEIEETPEINELLEAVAVVEEEARTKRVYNKRKKKFSMTEQNMLIRDVKAIGLVAAAAKWNSLPIYVSKAMKSRKVAVKRGRRPNPKVAVVEATEAVA